MANIRRFLRLTLWRIKHPLLFLSALVLGIPFYPIAGGIGKKKRVSVPAPKFQTADEIFQQAFNFAQQRFPGALQAREQALADVARGSDFFNQFIPATARQEVTPQFFSQFGPTSFEQALAQQQFANVLPDVERSIKQNLSLSGIASSPILAQLIGKARGRLGVDIGQYLAKLGQRRAELALNRQDTLGQRGLQEALSSLQGRLNIDPMAGLLTPFSQIQQTQGNKQAEANFQIALAEAKRKEAARQAKMGLIGTAIGGGLGLLVGQPALGASLGGSLAGGGSSPLGFGDALSLSKVPGFGGGDNLLAGLFKRGSTSSGGFTKNPLDFLGQDFGTAVGKVKPVNFGGRTFSF